MEDGQIGHPGPPVVPNVSKEGDERAPSRFPTMTAECALARTSNHSHAIMAIVWVRKYVSK